MTKPVSKGKGKGKKPPTTSKPGGKGGNPYTLVGPKTVPYVNPKETTPGYGPIVYPGTITIDGECGWTSLNIFGVTALSNILVSLMFQVTVVRGQVGGTGTELIVATSLLVTIFL